MISLLARRPDRLPSVLLMLASATWGVFWIPLRYLRDAGFEGAWSTSAYFGIGVAVLAPIALVRWRLIRIGGGALLLTGLLSGTAIALYILSFLFTTVAKALLLFYLTPVWSTLTGRFLLGEVITRARALALVLGLGGLWIILGGEGALPVPRNVGDWMALASGIIWAYAAVRLNQSDARPTEWLNVFMIGGLLVSVGCLVLRPEISTPPSLAGLNATAVWVLIAIAIVSLPINLIILWGANRLNPGRVGLLLMAEVVVGLAAAAVITDEPYGVREASGTVLILGAALVDILQQPGGHQ